MAGRIFSKMKSRYIGWLFQARGLYLGPGCTIKGSKRITFGRDIYVQGHLWMEAVTYYRGQVFEPRIQIGDEVSLSEGVHISCIQQISVGRNVLIGSRVYISDHNHGTYRGELQSSPEEPPAHRLLGGGGPVKIEDNVWIGDNVVIVGPISIGYGSVIGANAVVRGDVPPGVIVGGIPAKILRVYDSETCRWEKL
jgi:acetyltransferase-like isoleucine patch superfamily enzyme